MKRASREVNIFSMSALDLFASALGAFILLTVAALPFFPNTTTAPPSPECPTPKPAPTCPVCPEAPTCPEPKPVPHSSKAKLPPTDIVIAMDVTGSMQNQIDALKSNIADLGRILNRLTDSAGIGVIAFGDRRWSQPIFSQSIVDISNSSEFDALVRFINRMQPNMGLSRLQALNPDQPEAVDMALDQAIKMNWRSGSERRFIIILTDNPAYPEKINDTFQQAQKFAATQGHHVSTVLVHTPGALTQAKDYLKRLAKSGQGEFVGENAGGSFVAAILLALLK